MPALANFMGQAIILVASPKWSITHSNRSEMKGFTWPSKVVIHCGTSMSVPVSPVMAFSWSRTTLACSTMPPATPRRFDSCSRRRLDSASEGPRLRRLDLARMVSDRWGALMSNSHFEPSSSSDHVLTTRNRSALSSRPKCLAGSSLSSRLRSGAPITWSLNCRISPIRGCRLPTMKFFMLPRSAALVLKKFLSEAVISSPTLCTRRSPIPRTTPNTAAFCSSVR
mmetsp:Transcript_51328/g.135620  ORF Transcript_51328/g.135620 Transcript_51328/m.135620 type:complete len:225 (-) Transcript_51328:63-737(-)